MRLRPWLNSPDCLKHHPRQHEAFDCHAFKRNREEECVQMPVKIARLAPRPSFGLPELLVAIHTSRQPCCKAGKARIFTPVRESSGESRLMVVGGGGGAIDVCLA